MVRGGIREFVNDADGPVFLERELYFNPDSFPVTSLGLPHLFPPKWHLLTLSSVYIYS